MLIISGRSLLRWAGHHGGRDVFDRVRTTSPSIRTLHNDSRRSAAPSPLIQTSLTPPPSIGSSVEIPTLLLRQCSRAVASLQLSSRARVNVPLSWRPRWRPRSWSNGSRSIHSSYAAVQRFRIAPDRVQGARQVRRPSCRRPELIWGRCHLSLRNSCSIAGARSLSVTRCYGASLRSRRCSTPRRSTLTQLELAYKRLVSPLPSGH